MMLTDLVPESADPDALYAAFTEWAAAQGLTLYPHQDEALIEIVSGANVILSTPTGSGKSLVATAAHFAALAAGERSFYTAPIKALVSEKFFALCDVFGPANVGMMTGDGSVNAERPDHLLHRRGTRQHRAAGRRRGRRRPGDHGRVPLLRRPGPRLGLAGAADRAAQGSVPADVGHARRRHQVRARPDQAHRPADRRCQVRRAPRAAHVQVRARSAARDHRPNCSRPSRRRSTSSTSPRPPRSSRPRR